MAKKKQINGKSSKTKTSNSKSLANTSDDELLSVYSIDTLNSLTDTEIDDGDGGDGNIIVEQRTVVDQLNNILEALTEKRVSTRESALVRFDMMMSKYVIGEYIDSHGETVLSLLIRCLRRGANVKEKTMALKGIMLLFVQWGVEAEKCFDEITKILQELIYDASKPESLRCLAVQTLSFCAFIAGPIESIVHILLPLFESLIDSGKTLSILKQECIEGWSLLVTRVSLSSVRQFAYRVTKLASYLESDIVDTRVVAGEALALLINLALEDQNQMEDEDDCASESRLDDIDVDGIISTIENLAKESIKRHAKKDRAKQRASFRDILATIKSGDAPTKMLHFKGGETVNFSSWSELIFLSILREVLGEGLKTHFEENELIRDMFNLGAPHVSTESCSLSRTHKHQAFSHKSDYSKARTKSRLKNRDKRMQY